MMKKGINYYLGTHNFTAMRATSCVAKSPIRTITKAEIYSEINGTVVELLYWLVGCVIRTHSRQYIAVCHPCKETYPRVDGKLFWIWVKGLPRLRMVDFRLNSASPHKDLSKESFVKFTNPDYGTQVDRNEPTNRSHIREHYYYFPFLGLCYSLMYSRKAPPR